MRPSERIEKAPLKSQGTQVRSNRDLGMFSRGKLQGASVAPIEKQISPNDLDNVLTRFEVIPTEGPVFASSHPSEGRQDGVAVLVQLICGLQDANRDTAFLALSIHV